MGCGASKGTQAVAPPVTSSPVASKPELTPDSKTRLAAEQDDITKTKESRDSAAKRVDAIVKSGVADFEDDTDTAQDKPYTAESIQFEPVSALPPPPTTPPAAAKKPLFQTADTTNTYSDGPAEEEETSYFPQQVSLNVGAAGGAGGAYPPQQQLQLPPPMPTQVGLQPYGSTSARPSDPQLPAPQRTPPQASPAPVFKPSISSRQLQPLSPLQQQQSSAGQGQGRGQGQGQPLVESGPGPASAAAASTSAAASDDPWSSLQSTYRIRESQAVVKPDSARSRTGGSRDAGRELLVLGEDDDDFSGGGLNGTTNSTLNRTSGMGGRPPISLPPPMFGTAPKKGGWGSGAMAQAGELMLGEDDWLVKDRPPGVSAGSGQLPLQQQLPPQQPLPPPQQLPPQRQAAQQQATVMSYDSRVRLLPDALEERRPPVTLKGPAGAKAKPTEEVLCEDVEDVDTLLEDEMQRQGLSNKSLATKLAAYEAQFRDDD